MTDFDEIVAGLELDIEDLPESVADLDDLELVRRHEEVRQLLLRSGEMTADTEVGRRSTREGRDLHSERVALLVEMRKRGLK